MPGAAPSGFDKVKLRGGGIPERRVTSGANTPVRSHSRLRTKTLAVRGGERTPLLRNGQQESRSLE